jgi:hypothetical protein
MVGGGPQFGGWTSGLYFRTSPDYAHQTAIVDGKKVGADLNLYKLFLERCYRLLRSEAECGIIVTASVYNDLAAKGLRSLLFEAADVGAMVVLSNERFIFEGVHHDHKICIVDFKKGGRTECVRLAFRVHVSEAIWPNELEDFFAESSSFVTLPLVLVKSFSPDSFSLMDFREPREIDIAKKMFRFPLLREEIANRWSLRLANEFHMTGDSDLYETTKKPGYLPLIEGKAIHQFTDQWEQPKYWVPERKAANRLQATREREVRAFCAREKVGPSEAVTKLDYTSYRLAFRDVGTSTNERSMIMTVLPPSVFCPHTVSLEKVFRLRLENGHARQPKLRRAE